MSKVNPMGIHAMSAKLHVIQAKSTVCMFRAAANWLSVVWVWACCCILFFCFFDQPFLRIYRSPSGKGIRIPESKKFLQKFFVILDFVIQNPSSIDNESRIQDCLGFPYMGGEGRYTYRHMVAMACTRVSHVEDLAWNNLFHR